MRPSKNTISITKSGVRSATPTIAQQVRSASPGRPTGLWRRNTVYAAQNTMPTTTMTSPLLSWKFASTAGSPRVRIENTPTMEIATPSDCSRVIVSR